MGSVSMPSLELVSPNFWGQVHDETAHTGTLKSSGENRES